MAAFLKRSAEPVPPLNAESQLTGHGAPQAPLDSPPLLATPPDLKLGVEPTPPEVLPRSSDAGDGGGDLLERQASTAAAAPERPVPDESALWREGLIRVVNDLIAKMTSLDLELWEERRHSQELRAERDALATNLRQALEALEVMKRQQEEQTRERLQEFLVTYTRAVSDVRALEGQMGPVVQDSTVTEVRNIEVGMIVVRGRDWRSGDVDGCSWGVVTKCNAGQYGRTRVLWNATGLETVHVTTQSGSELREAPAWAKNGR
eukprot:XP_001696662.1 predicted protein [Chlamydomonas reinhardtii]